LKNIKKYLYRPRDHLHVKLSVQVKSSVLRSGMIRLGSDNQSFCIHIHTFNPNNVTHFCMTVSYCIAVL